MDYLIEWLSPLAWRIFNYSMAALAGVLALAVYRVFLYPLSHVPGPMLAAVISLYEFYYDGCLRGKYYWKVFELHQQYGKTLAVSRSHLAWLILQVPLCEFHQTRCVSATQTSSTSCTTWSSVWTKIQGPLHARPVALDFSNNLSRSTSPSSEADQQIFQLICHEQRRSSHQS